jgi:hypothetical protein
VGSYHQYPDIVAPSSALSTGGIIGLILMFGLIIGAAAFMWLRFPKRFKQALEQNSQHWEDLAHLINAPTKENSFPLVGKYNGYSVIAKISPFGGKVNKYEIHFLTGSSKGQDWRIRFRSNLSGKASWSIFALDNNFEQKVKTSNVLKKVAQGLERGDELTYNAKDGEILYTFQISSFGMIPASTKFKDILDVMSELAQL